MGLESMERWGIVGIFKEAARLFHKHFRLFLPFFLAFLLPASSLAVFENLFLEAPNSYTKVFFNCAHSTIHGGKVKDTDTQPHFILSFAFLSLIFIFSTLAAAAFTYIVDYIYSNTSDDSITRKVFKLLPFAFLRIFVTQIWVSLVLLLLAIACLLIALLLNALLSVLVGGDPSGFTPAFTILYLLPLVVATIAVAVVFALAQTVAVLEPGNYGRAALKQSRQYVRGRAGTIFGVIVFSELVGGLLFPAARAVTTSGLSLGMEIVVASVLSVLFSLLSAYVVLVVVVTYFVCKSSSDLAVLPVFSASAAQNPYMPVVSGSTQIDEP